MKLEDWLTVSCTSPAKFRTETGFSDEQARRYRRGQRTPNRAAMALIFSFSGGAVRPDDFFDLPPLSGAAARREAILAGFRKMVESATLAFERDADVSECLAGLASVLSIYQPRAAALGGAGAPEDATRCDAR